MKVGELFLEIGVKGAEKAKEALVDFKGNISGIIDTSLAAKAAILAIVYGLERLTMGLAHEGQGLRQYSDATGQSLETLEKWQKAARLQGRSVDDVTSSFKSLQTVMTNIQLNKGAPEFTSLIFKGGIDRSKMSDMNYVMSRIEHFAKTAPPNIVRAALATYGFSDAMIGLLRVNKYDVKNLKPDISEKEANSLNNYAIAWTNLFRSFQLFAGRQVLPIAGQALKTMSEDFKLVTNMINNLKKLAISFPTTAKIIGLSLAAIFAPWTTAIVALAYILSEIQKFREGNKDNIINKGKDMLTTKNDPIGNFMKNNIPTLSDFLIPQRGQGLQQQTNGGAKVEVNQTFHGPTEPHKTKKATKGGILEAYQQLQSNLVVS